ncbi:MAG: hypothetical protein ACYTHM_09905 [Planctomycetota bacterium]
MLQDYDGLNGKVIQWTLKHGNTNHDPAVLCWALDPKGNVLGRPGGKLHSASGFVSWLKEMGRASFPLIDPAKYTVLRSEAKSIAARKNLGTVLADLRGKAEKETGKAQEEARALLEKLLAYAGYQLDRAEKMKDEDPGEALAMYKNIAAMFKGDEVGEKADAIYTALKKDKAFQREIKAGALYRQMRELKNRINPKRPLDSPSNRKTVATLRALMQGLQKKFSDTKACEKAKKLMDALGK